MSVLNGKFDRIQYDGDSMVASMNAGQPKPDQSQQPPVPGSDADLIIRAGNGDTLAAQRLAIRRAGDRRRTTVAERADFEDQGRQAQREIAARVATLRARGQVGSDRDLYIKDAHQTGYYRGAEADLEQMARAGSDAANTTQRLRQRGGY